MTVDRTIYAVVCIIAVTAVVSGPLVGGVDVTAQSQDERASLSAGSASIGTVAMPGEAQFRRGEFGAQAIYLDVPAATIDVDGVDGRVQVSYQVSITDLGYTTGTTLVLGPKDVGRQRIDIERHAFDPDRLDADQYDAELTITLFEESGDREIAREQITLTVER